MRYFTILLLSLVLILILSFFVLSNINFGKIQFYLIENPNHVIKMLGYILGCYS